jgi:tetratricopeptide (TPR) repeat protein
MTKSVKGTLENKMLLIQALNGRADVLGMIGKYVKSIKDRESAVVACEQDSRIDGAKTARSILSMADAIARSTGDYSRALKLIEKASNMVVKEEHPLVIADAYNYRGTIAFHTGKYGKALLYQKKALGIYESLSNQKNIMQTYSSLGLLHHYRGELETALGYYYKALILAEKLDDKLPISTLSHHIGTVFRDMGDMETASFYFQRHLNMASQLGYKTGIANALGNIAITFMDRDQFKKANKLLTKSLAIFDRTGQTVGTIIALTNLGDSHLSLGNIKESKLYYERGLFLSTQIGYTMGTGISHKGLGRICGESKKFESARMHFTTAKELFEKIGDKLNVSEIYSYLSLLFSHRGKQGTALQFAKKALSQADETGAKEERILALRAMGVAQPKGASDKAVSYLEKSMSLATIAQRKFEYAKSLYELSVVLKRKKEIIKAKENLNKALKIFRDTESQNWAKRAHRLKKTLR